MKDRETIVALLKDGEHKVTKYRIALLALLQKRSEPLSVGEILISLESVALHPNKTTVYRELEYLILHKLVKELDLGDEKKRYELFEREHHHHLVCQNCNGIEDIVIEDDVKEIEKKISRSKKFQVLDHSMEFFGICANCR